MRFRFLVAFGLPAALVVSVASVHDSVGNAPPDEAARARCATRLSLSLTGRVPSPALLAESDPQTKVDELLADDAFVEQFSRYMNSQLNPEPGVAPADDATYWLASYVLKNQRPWHELFDGKYRVEPVAGPPVSAQVVADANGLGYFRSRNWMIRYAGNEEQGYRLSSAFRIQQNIIGLDVSAVTSMPGVNISSTGRMAPACSGCHFDSYFALDKVARVLSRRTGPADNPTFDPPTEIPQTILGGKSISSDAELVSALVGSTDHAFRTCRLAFQYLYGRAEANCEAPLFDACVDAYTTTGDVRSALRTIAQDPGFCE